MSKVALEHLLESVAKATSDATKDFRHNYLSSFTQKLIIDKAEMVNQLLAEINSVLRKAKRPSLDMDSDLRYDLEIEAEDAFDGIVKWVKANIKKSTPEDFQAGTAAFEKKDRIFYTQLSAGRIEVRTINPGGKNYATIDYYFTNNKSFIRKNILDVMTKNVNKLLREANVSNGSGGDFLAKQPYQLGHFDKANYQYYFGKIISDQLQNDPGNLETAIRGIELVIQNTNQKSTSSDYSAIIQAASKFVKAGQDAFLDKSFEISLFYESATTNQGKKENEIARDFISQVRKYVTSQSAEFWAEHQGSDSVVEGVAKSLMAVAMKEGARTKAGNLKINTTPAKTNKKLTTKIRNTEVGGKLKSKVTAETRRQARPDATTSYLSLITLLNERLPPKVRENMTGPRLHNRTGRFSESTRVTNITQTPQGFPSIEYSYQRSPYDVFDKTLGKAPWNSPGRDPSELVALSVRQLATELGMKRFFTRRAR